MKVLSTVAADSAECSARRTARAGARREPCMLNGHSSAKVGLEPGSIGKEPDVRAVRAGGTARDKRGQTLGCRGRRRMLGMASSWRVRAAPPWIRQRLWCERAAQPELKAGSPIAFATGHAGTKWCHDPEPILIFWVTDDTHTSRCVDKFLLSDHRW